MNIEAGKYYRMRCGGAVRIEEEKKGYYSFRGKGESWTKEGNFDLSDTCLFDLVAEITEAEYNRIVSGFSESWITQTKKEKDEIEALKTEIETLKQEKAVLVHNYQIMHEKRRFEAAKAAMQGMKANIQYKGADEEDIAHYAVTYADALLKALEETK